ncbi:hypothetical protein K7432_001098 [Basidiobolus ranarum]|uniref:Uncharacterized protein n=1 Tax=Basidiobolus ranarum TaxID=34480 RepID=A0ABR2WA44_9FUNG
MNHDSTANSRPTTAHSATGTVYQQTRPHVTQAYSPTNALSDSPVPEQPGFFSKMAASPTGVSIGHSLRRGFAGLSGDEEVPVGFDEKTGELIMEQSKFSSRFLGSAALFSVAGASWRYRQKVIQRAGLPSLAGPMKPLMTIILVSAGFLGVINLSN